MQSKISREQKKTYPSMCQILNGGQTIVTETTAPHEPVNSVPTQTTGSNDTSAPSTNQSAMQRSQSGDSDTEAQTTQSPLTIQNGGAQVPMEAYMQGLLTELTRGQVQARNGFASDSFQGNSVLSDNGHAFLGATSAKNVNSPPPVQSLKDPQIYLSSAANGKSASSHYDIVDFVSGNVEEEIVVGGSGSNQAVLKSGPKLENVSLAQQTMANLAILYKLNGEAKLTGDGILDYL